MLSQGCYGRRRGACARTAGRKHEQYINGAVGLDVDAIQAGNVPKVANNTGFTAMLAEIVRSNGQASRKLEREFDAAANCEPNHLRDVSITERGRVGPSIDQWMNE